MRPASLKTQIVIANQASSEIYVNQIHVNQGVGVCLIGRNVLNSRTYVYWVLDRFNTQCVFLGQMKVYLISLSPVPITLKNFIFHISTRWYCITFSSIATRPATLSLYLKMIHALILKHSIFINTVHQLIHTVTPVFDYKWVKRLLLIPSVPQSYIPIPSTITIYFILLPLQLLIKKSKPVPPNWRVLK